MQLTEGVVTIRFILDDDTQCQQIVYPIQADLLILHLPINGKKVLGPPGDGTFDARLRHGILQRTQQLGDQPLPLSPGLINASLDFKITARIKDLESQVLQFPLDFGNTETIGKRHIHIHCFLGDGHLAILVQEFYGTHIVQAIGKFDQDRAWIPGDGQNQLPVGLGLAGILVDFLQATDLCDTVNHVGHLWAKPAFNVLEGEVRILHHIMHHRRQQGVDVHAQVGKDLSHYNGMQEKRLTAFSKLPGMSLFGKMKTAPQTVPIRLGIKLLNPGPDPLHDGQTGGRAFWALGGHDDSVGLISTSSCCTGS